MTVRAEHLDVSTRAFGYLAVERDAVDTRSFDGAASFDVVQLQNPLIAVTAVRAASSKGGEGLGFPLRFSASARLTAEFLGAVGVCLSPSGDAAELALVDARLTDAAPASLGGVELGDRLGRLASEAGPGLFISHIEKPSGIRKDVAYDELMGSR